MRNNNFILKKLTCCLGRAIQFWVVSLPLRPIWGPCWKRVPLDVQIPMVLLLGKGSPKRQADLKCVGANFAFYDSKRSRASPQWGGPSNEDNAAADDNNDDRAIFGSRHCNSERMAQRRCEVPVPFMHVEAKRIRIDPNSFESLLWIDLIWRRSDVE